MTTTRVPGNTVRRMLRRPGRNLLRRAAAAVRVAAGSGARAGQECVGRGRQADADDPRADDALHRPDSRLRVRCGGVRLEHGRHDPHRAGQRGRLGQGGARGVAAGRKRQPADRSRVRPSRPIPPASSCVRASGRPSCRVPRSRPRLTPTVPSGISTPTPCAWRRSRRSRWSRRASPRPSSTPFRDRQGVRELSSRGPVSRRPRGRAGGSGEEGHLRPAEEEVARPRTARRRSRPPATNDESVHRSGSDGRAGHPHQPRPIGRERHVEVAAARQIVAARLDVGLFSRPTREERILLA